MGCMGKHGLGALVTDIGTPIAGHTLSVETNGQVQLQSDLRKLHQAWSETSHEIQKLRDHPDCANEEFASTLEWRRPFLSTGLSFDPQQDPAAPAIASGIGPAVAILREQGVNGQIEMAAAFDAAGFRAIDVHMSDLLENRISLSDFQGLVACGGFSYGDVLGAGPPFGPDAKGNADEDPDRQGDGRIERSREKKLWQRLVLTGKNCNHQQNWNHGDILKEQDGEGSLTRLRLHESFLREGLQDDRRG